MATKILRLVKDRKKDDVGGLLEFCFLLLSFLSWFFHVCLMDDWTFFSWLCACFFTNLGEIFVSGVTREVELQGQLEELQDHVKNLEKENINLKSKVGWPCWMLWFTVSIMGSFRGKFNIFTVTVCRWNARVLIFLDLYLAIFCDYQQSIPATLQGTWCMFTPSEYRKKVTEANPQLFSNDKMQLCLEAKNPWETFSNWGN